MARVLVTGCAGFIGSHLAERLLHDGHEVVGVDCLTDFYDPALKARTLERLTAHARFEQRLLDLSRDLLDEPLEGVETVYHLAGQPGVRQSFSAPEPYLRHNVIATRRLLAAAAAAPCPSAFVYASSSSIYGDGQAVRSSNTRDAAASAHPGRTRAHPDRMRETDAPAPISPYGRTKVAVEQLAQGAWNEHGLATIGMRYFSVYGPRQRPDMAFQRFLERALRAEPLEILGDGSQRRDFTYVEDVVAATIAAAEHGHAGAVYNVGGGQPATLGRVVALLGELLERDLRVEHRPAAPGDVRATAADTSRARRELGFTPRTQLAEGVALQLDWLLAAAQRATAAA